MSKRDEFWQSVIDRTGYVQWPDDPDARAKLAARVAGATFVGALDHILEQSLRRLNGRPPEPGSHDYASNAADAATLATLTPEQKAATERLLRSTSHSSVYWPFVKLRSMPGLGVDFNVVPMKDGQHEMPAVTLNEILDLHSIFMDWVEEFAEFVSNDV